MAVGTRPVVVKGMESGLLRSSDVICQLSQSGKGHMGFEEHTTYNELHTMKKI